MPRAGSKGGKEKEKAAGHRPVPGRSDREAIEGAIRRLEERLMAMEARLSDLEARACPSTLDDPGEQCCSDQIIGCLEDCVEDVKDLRKKARDVRSARRH